MRLSAILAVLISCVALVLLFGALNTWDGDLQVSCPSKTAVAPTESGNLTAKEIARNERFALLLTRITKLIRHRYNAYVKTIRFHGRHIETAEILQQRLPGQQKARCGNTRVAICAVVTNEGPYIQEWITHHILQGVSHFYLYDYNSTDETYNLMTPFVDIGYVTRKKAAVPDTQQNIYTSCAAEHKTKNDWLLMIDANEFIHLGNSSCVNDILDLYSSYPAVQLQWALFTTDNVTVHNNSQLSIEQHKRRLLCINVTKAAHNTKYLNKNSKIDVHSIASPVPSNPPIDIRRVPVPAQSRLSSPYRELQPGVCNYGYVQLNHYFTRSFEEYLLKCGRGFSIGPLPRLEQMLLYEEETHISDFGIERAVQRIRKVLFG